MVQLLQLYQLNYIKLIVIIVLIKSKEVLVKMIMVPKWKPGKAKYKSTRTSKKMLRISSVKSIKETIHFLEIRN